MNSLYKHLKNEKTLLSLIVTFACIYLCTRCYKKTKKLPDNSGKEVYNVLKSDESTLQGSYKKTNNKGAVLLEGYYKNGLKDSLWKEYNRNGTLLIEGYYKDDLKDGIWKFYDWNKILCKVGNYKSDKMIGLWNFFDYKGKPEMIYDFSTKKLISFEIDEKEKNKEYKMFTENGFKMVKLDCPPLYLGGSFEIIKILGTNINYPVVAQENSVSGKVDISFTIDSHGKTSNYKIIKGIGSGCDEEALRVVMLIPENWLPATYNGNAVSVEYHIPVSYKLQ